jgi:hypothetical protein
VKRILASAGLLIVGGAAAWQAALALQDVPAPTPPVEAQAAPAEAPTDAEANAPKRAPTPPLSTNPTATPMAERVATLGVLNKRNGLSRDLTLKPGKAVRLGDLVVRLRACEETAPWEPEKWTGAFVQVITRESGTRWRKIFSGWLYKESPSINLVQHPIYDVWVKACKMRHADVGPGTIVARGGDMAGGSGKASNAEKSPEAAPEAPVADSASSNNPE